MLPEPFRVPEKRCNPGLWLMLAGVFAISFAMFYTLAFRPSSDISIHAAWTAQTSFADPISFVRRVAHPLWHVMVRTLMYCGLPLELAAALITSASKVAEVWLIHRLMTVALHEHLSRTAITLAALACSLVSCLCLPWYNPTVYYGVGTPNTWHSSTQLLTMVFMLLCVPLTAHCYDHFVRLEPEKGRNTLLPWREPVTLGVLLLLSLVAKPTFMQAFLPAACLFFLVQWLRYPKNSRYFLQVIVCVLPSVLFMIAQYLYYFGSMVPGQDSMVLEFSLEKVQGMVVRTVLMTAFPLYVLWACRRQAKDTQFWLTLIFNAVAIVEFLFLGEGGHRAYDGNFGWAMMGSAMMLWVIAMIRFLRDRQMTKPCVKSFAGWALLAWHLVSGVYYMGYLFWSGKSL